jgi:hypothetical protein
VTPWRVSAYLKKQYTADPGLSRCVFTSETMGDYLLWDLRLEPPVRIFCYTHVHLLTPEHWQECLIVKSADRRWQEVLDRHGVEFLVVERNPLYEPLIRKVVEASTRWEPVPVDERIFVARRRHPDVGR